MISSVLFPVLLFLPVFPRFFLAARADGDCPQRPDQRREGGALHPGHAGAVTPQARLLVGEGVRVAGRRDRLTGRSSL